MLELPFLFFQPFLAALMSQIIISTLFPAGSEFFQDAESFLDDLAASELKDVAGGTSVILSLPIVLYSVLSAEHYPSLVQTKVTVSVAVGFKTTSVVTIG